MFYITVVSTRRHPARPSGSLFQCIGVAGVCTLWHGIVLLLSTWYNLYICLCRSFVTTELVSLGDEESARTLGVLDVDEYIEKTV